MDVTGLNTGFTSTTSTYNVLEIIMQSGKLPEYIKKTIDLGPNSEIQMNYSNNNKELIDLSFENGEKIHIEKEYFK